MKPAAIVAATIALALAVGLGDLARAVPEAERWARFEGHVEDSRIHVDHRDWGAFLAAWLVTDTADGIHRVRYGAVTPEARAALDAYIARLGDVRPTTLSRDEQFAFWVNLYNAATVALILSRWPVGSIREIRLGGLFAVGPWSAKLLKVDGESLSLDDIEHRILRPIWNDPRIHYAVNCASLGCPDLAAEPWDPARLEAQLEAAARRFLRHPRALRFEDGVLHLSSLFDWYAEDFGRDSAARLAHLQRYVDPAVAERLSGYRGKVRYAYDWRINAAN